MEDINNLIDCACVPQEDIDRIEKQGLICTLYFPMLILI